jgi:uncharacterized protein (DUF305 family)
MKSHPHSIGGNGVTLAVNHSNFASQMHECMARMWSEMHAAASSGNSDIDFLAMMIPHHEAAIEMSRLILAAGKDPITREMAENIASAQRSEIMAMKGRMAKILDQPALLNEYPALSGTRGEAR